VKNVCFMKGLEFVVEIFFVDTLLIRLDHVCPGSGFVKRVNW
jgi:hypothetical protein